jgi:hypothetical protein
MMRLVKKTSKKMPMASNRLIMFRLPETPPSRYLWAVSNKTMAMASLRMDSPKMTVYSFGSTLYRLKMARMVTGSVADSVAPTEIASTQVMVSPSNGIRVHNHRIRPNDTADMNVPAKAKVKMVPIFRKKLACSWSQCRSGWRLPLEEN